MIKKGLLFQYGLVEPSLTSPLPCLFPPPSHCPSFFSTLFARLSLSMLTSRHCDVRSSNCGLSMVSIRANAHFMVFTTRTFLPVVLNSSTGPYAHLMAIQREGDACTYGAEQDTLIHAELHGENVRRVTRLRRSSLTPFLSHSLPHPLHRHCHPPLHQRPHTHTDAAIHPLSQPLVLGACAASSTGASPLCPSWFTLTPPPLSSACLTTAFVGDQYRPSLVLLSF